MVRLMADFFFASLPHFFISYQKFINQMIMHFE